MSISEEEIQLRAMESFSKWWENDGCEEELARDLDKSLQTSKKRKFASDEDELCSMMKVARTYDSKFIRPKVRKSPTIRKLN